MANSRVKIELPSGEVLYLPEQVAVDTAQSEQDVPSAVIPGRSGVLPYGEIRRMEPGTITLSGPIVGTADGEYQGQVLNREFADSMIEYWRGKLYGAGLLKVWRYDDAVRYVHAYCKRVDPDFHRGHFRGGVIGVQITLWAHDPYWYADERIIDTMYCGPSFRAEAENESLPTAGNGRAWVNIRGTWGITAAGSASNGYLLYSASTSSYIEVTFYGTGIVLVYRKTTVGGIAGILIDGSAPISNPTVDMYTAGDTYLNATSWTGLTPGLHTLRVTVSGTKNGASTGYYIYPDAFDIIGTDLVVEDNAGTAFSYLRSLIESADRQWFLDFMAKVAGSTIVNKAVAKSAADTTDLVPASGTWAELIQNDYNAIYMLDDSLATKSSVVNTERGMFLFSYDLTSINAVVANLRTYARRLVLKFWGYGEGVNTAAIDWTARLLLWNRSTTAWVEQTSGAVPIGALFARASTAYERGVSANGTDTEEAANVPRFEWGRFHNRLTPNQSDVETDTTGFGSTGAAVSQVTSGGGDGDASHGTGFLKVVTNNAAADEGAIVSAIDVDAGLTYIASVKIRGAAGGETVKLHLREFDSLGVLQTDEASGVLTLTTDWVRYSVALAFSATAGFKANIHVKTDVKQGITFYVDELQIQSVNTGETSPLAWCLGGTGKAIRIEEGTENLVTKPEDLTNATGGWTETNCNTADAGGDARGIYNYTQITLTAGNGQVDRTVSLTGDGVKAIQGIFKQSGDSIEYLQLRDTTAGVSRATIRIMWATQTVTATTGTLIKAEWLSNTEVLVLGYSTSCTAANTHQIQIIGTDNGQDFYATAVQVENKAYPTYYQGPDTSLTRAAENLTIPTGGLTRHASGTVYTDGTIEAWVCPKRSFGTTPQGIFGTDTTGANRFTLMIRETSGKVTVVAATAFIEGTTVTVRGTYYYVAVTWTATTVTLYVNGTPEGTGARGNFLFTPPARIGDYSGGAYLDGLVSGLRISNKAKSAAEIATEYNTTKAPFTREACTTYLNNFDGTLAYVCPFEKELTASLTDYIDDAGKVHMLTRPSYNSDGADPGAIYADRSALEVTRCYAKLGANVQRVRRNLLLNSSFETADTWTDIATYRRYGDARSGSYFIRLPYTGDVDQDAIAILASQKYGVGVFAREEGRATGSTGKLRIHFSWRNAVNVEISTDDVDLSVTAEDWTWYKAAAVLTAPSNATAVNVTIDHDGNALDGDIYDVDCIMLVQSDALPEGWLADEELALTCSAALEVGTGTEVTIDPEVPEIVEDDGTDHTGLANAGYVVDRMKVKHDKNYIRLAGEGDKLWNLKMRYKPRSY